MEATGIKADHDRPTLLMVGDGEVMDAALRVALDRHGLSVEACSAATVVESVLAAAPDLLLLVGDAAVEGGREVLALLSSNPATAAVPVAVLSEDTSLDQRMRVFRHGAVAVVPRGASADAIGRRIAEVARELPERPGEVAGELGEATLDEFVDLVKRELRSGILSVEGGGEANEAQALRLVLGAGRPVSEALSDFVQRLRPLIEKAEPLRYELIEEPGGRTQLLDPEDTGEGANLEVLRGLRVLVVDDDPGRADALAQELRAREATVVVTDATGRGLDRARHLDPEVVILDAAGVEGPGFDVVRTLRCDPRFRWAQLLVASWDEIWPGQCGVPDMQRLAARIEPLVEQDRALRERARTETQLDTRLEVTGPSRMLRALCQAPGPFHVIVRTPETLVEIDVAEGLIVGASGSRHGESETFEGTSAIAALLALSSGRVRVERRGNPKLANVMMPVDEAIAAAWSQAPPIDPSLPPASNLPRARSDDTERIDVLPAPRVPGPGAGVDAPKATGETRRDSAVAVAPPRPAVPIGRIRLKKTVLVMPRSANMPKEPSAPSGRKTPPAPRPGTNETPTVTPPPTEPMVPHEGAPLPERRRSEGPKRGSGIRSGVRLLLVALVLGGAAVAVAFVPGLRERVLGGVEIAGVEPVEANPRPPVEPVVGEAPVEEPVVDEPPVAEGDPAAEGEPAEEAPAPEEPPSGEEPSEAVPSEEERAGEEPSEAVPSEEERAGEEPSEAVPSEERAGEEPSEAVPSEEEPAGEEAPVEEEPAEEPSGDELAGELAHLSADALVQRGHAALREGDLARAESLYRAALEKDPRQNHAMAGLAQVHVERGEATEAVEWAERAVQLRPRRTAYRIILGDAYALAGRTGDARREYRRALRDEPRNPAAIRGLEALRGQ